MSAQDAANASKQIGQSILEQGLFVVVASIFLFIVLLLVAFVVWSAKQARTLETQRYKDLVADRNAENERVEKRTEVLTRTLVEVSQAMKHSADTTRESIEATKENTNMYKNTLQMHEKMDEDIATVKTEIKQLKSDIKEVELRMEEFKNTVESNQEELINGMNLLTDAYRKLNATLLDKIDILLEKEGLKI